MIATVGDIIRLMEKVSPVSLAEEWDNVGLQVGQKDWEVHIARVALDPAPDVVASACRDHADILITHHPLIFKPLKSLDFTTYPGSVIQMAIQHKLAIFSAHTNLDSVNDGVNDALADRIELKNLKPLRKTIENDCCKLVIYMPVEHEHRILNALFQTGAGKIGKYDCCSFRNPGKGTFKPGALSMPFIGKPGEISNVDEIRVEAVVLKNELHRVIEHVRKHHPYETMAYDVYPLLNSENQGIGRVGELKEGVDLASFANAVKNKLGLPFIKIAGKPDLMIQKVALSSGSGSSLMKDFFSSDAQVFISGDLHYHDARDVEYAHRGLIDIGHFASEHLIVEVLANRLLNMLTEAGMEVNVEACTIEKDPFTVI